VNLISLDEALQGFLNSGAYILGSQQDMNTGEHVIYGQITTDPPVLEWAPLIGDFLHDLRSSLDHIAWALTDKSLPPPDPRAWDRVSFPIVEKEPDWGSAVGRSLWGVDQKLHARFKAQQPFATGPTAPDREPLFILNRLWNIDKHRYSHLTDTFVGLTDVLPTSPVEMPAGWEMTLTVVSQRDPGPLEKNTVVELGRVLWEGDFIVSIPQMYMDPRLAFGITFDPGEPAFGAVVVPLLQEIQEAVGLVVTEFKPELTQVP